MWLRVKGLGSRIWGLRFRGPGAEAIQGLDYLPMSPWGSLAWAIAEYTPKPCST